ncbi:MAG: hypothetical protein IAE93_05275 [Ignavibacteria bacterium]|nr:hypothetical protein [Ignavibacteria bacterium]
MEKSTATEILKTFSKEELSRFKDFTASPYHNKNSNVTKLCSALLKHAPAFPHEKVTREELWKKIFPAKKYNYGIMKNLMHGLSNLARSFIAFEKFANNELYYNRFLIPAAREKNLLNMHMKTLRRQNKLIEKMIKDEFYYEEVIATAREHLTANIDNTYIDETKITMQDGDLKLFLLKYFIGSLSLLTEEQRTNIKHDFEFTKNLLNYFEGDLPKFKEDVILTVYFYLMKSSLELNNESLYNETRRLVENNLHVMNHMTKRNCYAVFIALCNRKIYLYPDKTNEYQNELLKIHLEMLEKSLLGPENSVNIHIEMFRNIVVMCNFGKETDILNGVIEKYAALVLNTDHESLKNYSYAFLNIMKGNFEKCLELCSKINFLKLYQPAKGSFWFKNDIKQLEIMCYFELGHFEELLGAADSYRHFIVNCKQMNDIMKTRNLKFNHYTVKLTQSKMDGNPFPITSENFEKENVAGKSWLKSKITEHAGFALS